MAATLITFDEALDQLNMLDATSVKDERTVKAKMASAEAEVLTFLEYQDTGWTSETVPPDVKEAIRMVFAFLWENRGDEDKGEPLGTAARCVLRMWRVPVFA